MQIINLILILQKYNLSEYKMHLKMIISFI